MYVLLKTLSLLHQSLPKQEGHEGQSFYTENLIMEKILIHHHYNMTSSTQSSFKFLGLLISFHLSLRFLGQILGPYIQGTYIMDSQSTIQVQMWNLYPQITLFLEAKVPQHAYVPSVQFMCGNFQAAIPLEQKQRNFVET